MRDSHPVLADLAPGLALAGLRRALVACDWPGIDLAVLHSVARPEAATTECRIVLRTLEKVPDWERPHGRHRAGRLAAYVNRAPLQQDRLLHTPPVCGDRSPLRNSSRAARRTQSRPAAPTSPPFTQNSSLPDALALVITAGPSPATRPRPSANECLFRRSGLAVRLIRSESRGLLTCVRGWRWLVLLLSPLLSALAGFRQGARPSPYRQPDRADVQR